MRNLSRIDNYLNKQDALKTWLFLAKYAHMTNQTLLVRQCQPADNAGWRKIDKASSKLFASLKVVEQTHSVGLPLVCPHCKTKQADLHGEYCPLNVKVKTITKPERADLNKIVV